MALAFSGRFGTDDGIFGTDLRDLDIAVQDGLAVLYASNGLNGGRSWPASSCTARPGSAPGISSRQRPVAVRDFTSGEDRLDLSLFDALYSAGQLEA